MYVGICILQEFVLFNMAHYEFNLLENKDLVCFPIDRNVHLYAKMSKYLYLHTVVICGTEIERNKSFAN